MSVIDRLYRDSLALLTDFYELTMAYSYWKSGRHEEEAVFHLVFREHPFGGGYTLACGLERVVEYLRRLRFDRSDIEYLASLAATNDGPLLERGFLEYLSTLEFSCDIDAIPEGTVVFPHEPLLRVSGPLLLAQILETPLLNIVNFQTLIATKAARVVEVAGDDPVLEFGLRRAQGFDGGLAASWAAHVGGCAATSNVLAGKLFGIPVKGTHAHSWVMSFPTEEEAFESYAAAMPENCVFLVDTYNTIEGCRRAVRCGRRLRERGHEMEGVRLDSGDLATLAPEARRILDEAGFERASIVASGDLDEHVIESLKRRGTPIGVWGVGTRLVTGYDQPALGGVYKLTATRRQQGDGAWRYTVKVSDEPAKSSVPGILQVRRYRDDDGLIGDMIHDVELGIRSPTALVELDADARRHAMPTEARHEDLLVPVFRGGKTVHEFPTIAEIRARAAAQLAALPDRVKRSRQPARYLTGLEVGLHELRNDLMKELGP